MTHNYYTNEDLLKGVQVLARQMTLESWKPDMVVGVLRGGVIPAVYLSHWFNVPMMSIEWSTRDSVVGKDIDDRIISRLLNGDRILVVDDICDSGLTLDEVINEFIARRFNESNLNKSPFNLKTACLHFNVDQELFVPDYWHLEINKSEDPRWVVYEWENI